MDLSEEELRLLSECLEQSFWSILKDTEGSSNAARAMTKDRLFAIRDLKERVDAERSYRTKCNLLGLPQVVS